MPSLFDNVQPEQPLLNQIPEKQAIDTPTPEKKSCACQGGDHSMDYREYRLDMINRRLNMVLVVLMIILATAAIIKAIQKSA